MTFIENVDTAGQPVPAPRPRHTEEYLRTVYACGARNDHRVRIHRANWPPVQNPSLNDRPFVEGVCERCGGTVQIYDPPDRSVTVVLYGDPRDKQGRVEDEAGTVVEEAQVPAAGGVVEEEDEPPQQRPRGGRR